MSKEIRNCRDLFRPARRQWLQISGLGALTLAWPNKASANLAASAVNGSRRFGQANSCVFIFLFGGPGQQDLWDLKPAAPAEMRSEFQPIATSASGIFISDQLPHLCKQADKFAIVRSVSHKDFEHGSASYTALTGHPHPKPGTNTPASDEDFPTFGAVVAKRNPTTKPVPNAVVLGSVMHQGNRPPLAGQNAGFFGTAYEPFRIAGDPNAADFQVSGLATPQDVSAVRLNQRFDFLRRLDETSSVESVETTAVAQLKARAFGLLGSSQSQRAFDLSKESAKTRERFGRHKFGQTMLLARRLVEAEVPFITINWSKLNADQWDTHKQNYPKLRELLPQFDQGFAAFLEDLDQRGLLDTTLVVCLGEFGRTPKINKDAGRDHWPDCYSVVLAGGGIKRGFVLGASDRQAAYPVTDAVAPWDLAATTYHLLGLDPHMHVFDRLNRPFKLAQGRVIQDLF